METERLSNTKLADDASSVTYKGRFGVSTWLLVLVVSLVAFVLFPDYPYLVMLLGAFACGWCETSGACGMSHVVAITPIRKFDASLWQKLLFSYVIGGVVTSTMVGAVIGSLGLMFTLESEYWFYLAAALGGLLVLRSIGVLTFKIPQVPFQTDRRWERDFGFRIAAAMWGSHIGLGWATVIAHGSIYPLSAICLGLGPAYAAILFVTFWLGRTAPIVLAPVIFNSTFSTDEAIDQIFSNEVLLRRASALFILVLLVGASAILSPGMIGL